MNCRGLPTRFKTMLYDFGVDELVELYQQFLDLEVDLKWANPFVNYLRVVGEVLEEKYPDMWAKVNG